MEDIYQKVQQKIDQHSVGFSTTQSGIEIQILQKLLTPEEASIYLELTHSLEPPETIARRANKEVKSIVPLLESITEKGFTFPRTKDGVRYYAAAPFMHGFFEHQAQKGVMDRELAKMYEDYFYGGFAPKTHSLRTVPINQIVEAHSPILPFDDVKKIIESKSKIIVTRCACAARMSTLDSECKRPQEVCIGFDFYAEYGAEELGVGRWITQQEALDIVIQAEEAGLVHQTGGNSISTECICNCCPDCCVGLRGFKLTPEPARYSGSNYFAQLNQDECILCEACVDRCPMTAISVTEDHAAIDPNRCLGCGLCTSVCPVEAIALRTKDKVKPPPSPEKYKFMRPSFEFYRDLEKK